MLCLLCSSPAIAQQTKSYACVSCYGPTGMLTTPTLSVYVTFYDGYIIVNGSSRFNYTMTNYDGSMQFYPSVRDNAGTVGMLVSGDLSMVRQITQSATFGMPMQMTYNYQYLGEGSQPALAYMGINSTPSVPSYNSGASSGRDWADCSICGGTGRCKYCGGSGHDSSTRNGRCGVCLGTGRCSGCDGKRGYYY